ncbi:uncharacterized protein [Drosophila tropicalis]|uniref:uncharacterized protein n=1 Tax=Drosophila tropicalis TaxID=46794 RepID=UPI0035ABE192
MSTSPSKDEKAAENTSAPSKSSIAAPGQRQRSTSPTTPPSRAFQTLSSPLTLKSAPSSTTFQQATSEPRRASQKEVKSLVPLPQILVTAPRVTRSETKRVLAASTMALKKFVSICDKLSQFEVDTHVTSLSEVSVFTLQVRRDRVQALWEKVEQEYEKCEALSDGKDDSSEDLAIQAKYDKCYQVYERCTARLNELIHEGSAPTPPNRHAPTSAPAERGCRLPPIDTEVFTGDYLKWPTFRDLFTAIYISDSRISPVEKLYHLLAKTRGEANLIVAKFPLTNDGFETAWNALKQRFENKRLIVNSQFRALLDLPQISHESGKALQDHQNALQASIRAFEHCGLPVTTWGGMFVFFCSIKLPKNTLSLWEQSLGDKTAIPEWQMMDDFLTERFRTLEAVENTTAMAISVPTSKPPRNPIPATRKANTFEAKVTTKPKSCDLCMKENHPVRRCPRFLQMTVPERVAYIKKKSLCLNCFARGHQVKDCPSQHNCFTCKGRHNTLLHKDARPENNPTSVPAQPSSHNIVRTYFTSEARSSRDKLLGTAIVDFWHKGTTYASRALLDPASEANFISERMFRLMKLPFQTVRAEVTGINGKVNRTLKVCHISIRSSHGPPVQIEIEAFVLSQVADDLPSCTIAQATLEGMPNIPLADPSFRLKAKIDLLLGIDVIPAVTLSGIQTEVCGSLMAQETRFGWVISGPLQGVPVSSCAAFTTRVAVSREEGLETLLTRFWEVEDLPGKPVGDSDSVCEVNFQKTTRRDVSGRYTVSLPFRDPTNINLGHSRPGALAQFLKNESRLLKNIPAQTEYDAVIQEYLDLGHMRQVPFDGTNNNFYLPHHAVFKPDSTTTKVRVVFNASSKSTNGVSLNDILYPGPVLQSDLTTQILKWRFFRVVFNADITKMYRQIMVDPIHTPFQRILFRNKEGQLGDYELNTVTFGINCAPFLAIRVLQQLASDVQSKFPLASDIIKSYMYVDDVLAGAHNETTAIAMVNELQDALGSAGFPLRKWTSNVKSVLSCIPKSHLLNADFLDIEEASTAKTLGIRWKATTDEFYFVISPQDVKSAYTKREVLGQIAKLFDPAGWLAPFVIQAKVFMQELWLQELGWDDQLPSELHHRWQDFTKSYSFLDQIRIPRWVLHDPNSDIQFHCFCDASQRAYGAAIYVRRNWQLQFFRNFQLIMRRLVANRVAKIVTATNDAPWNHVSSEDNPADLPSRGLSAQELVHKDLWWHGPPWLREPQESWQRATPLPLDTALEKRVVKVHVAIAKPANEILSRFSNLARALRVIAYVIRFGRRCRKLPNDYSGEVTSSEINQVLQALIRVTQRDYFPTEHRCLQQKKSLPTSSTILNLNPFIDVSGVIRACGRVQQAAALSYDERNPILLPVVSPLSRLLVLFTHQISLHGGSQLVVRLIRQRYWIPRLRNLVKSVVNSCKVCVIYKRRLQSQLMGTLPAQRTTFARPFTTTGIDFAGPFDIKSFTGRACRISKGYVCVFVCFSTKAIHLEATSDLSTEAFLAAFARFVSRRGCPQQVQSDNGKNFVGASRVLEKDFLSSTQQKILSHYSHQNLSWHFIPPGAPHMGGLWEAGVKSFKTLFYKATCNQRYTFEEFSTLLAKVEACLNSRPISPMSEDPTDSLALTPGHFLVGGPLLSVTEPEIKDQVPSIINRWQRLKAVSQHFCTRWKDEYLKELHKRNKWRFPSKNLEVGDLVVLKDDNLPFNEWRLGRIHQTHPGSDGNVRVVELLTARGIVKRPVANFLIFVNLDPVSMAPRPRSVQASKEERRCSRGTESFRCRVCRGIHPLKRCRRFLRLNVEKRMRAVLANKYCANCLAHQHSGGSCLSGDKCRICEEDHHTLLHFHEQPRRRTPSSVVRRVTPESSRRRGAPTPASDPKLTLTTLLQHRNPHLMPTAMVRIETEGKTFDVKALVDPCSAVSSMATSLATAFKLTAVNIGAEKAVAAVIRSPISEGWRLEAILKVVDGLCCRTPSAPVDPQIAKRFEGIVLADETFYRPSSVSLVLGADVITEVMLEGSLPGVGGRPIAMRTVFGWTLSGACH